jgi:hypothetical protein
MPCRGAMRSVARRHDEEARYSITESMTSMGVSLWFEIWG